MDTNLNLVFPKGWGGIAHSNLKERGDLIREYKLDSKAGCLVGRGETMGHYVGCSYRYPGNDNVVRLYKPEQNQYRLTSVPTSPYRGEPIVHQNLTLYDDVRIKTTEVLSPLETPISQSKNVAKRLERQWTNGDYTVDRFSNGERVSGYECNLNEIGRNATDAERKALPGFKGKLEKFAMNFAQDGNGCERPVLRRISGTVIKLLRRR